MNFKTFHVENAFDAFENFSRPAVSLQLQLEVGHNTICLFQQIYSTWEKHTLFLDNKVNCDIGAKSTITTIFPVVAGRVARLQGGFRFSLVQDEVSGCVGSAQLQLIV